MFRPLPEERIKAQVMLEPCLQTPPAANPSPEEPKSDVHRQAAGPGASTPASEPRKSRVRERRREGRSKTFDWSEFKMEQTEKPAKERADTVDLSSSLSTTALHCSPSSSPASSASSPVSSSSLQTSSVSGAHPPSVTEAEEDSIRGSVTTSATHTPNPVTVTVLSTLNTTSPVQPLKAECQDQGKMEVDHPVAGFLGSGHDKENRTSGVQEEIEQRWHQVEMTPLREEKQVPITTALGNSDRLPAHELAALLDKEVCFLNVVTKQKHIYSTRGAITFIFCLHSLFSWDRSKRNWTNCRSKTTFWKSSWKMHSEGNRMPEKATCCR